MRSVIVSADAHRQLAPTGAIRVAINVGNPALAKIRTPGGSPVGPAVDIAAELGRELKIEVELVQFASAGGVAAALERREWDVAFLAIDATRAEKIAFTRPYMQIEGTYAVRSDAQFQDAIELDRAETRIAVAKNAAYDLHLTRTLQHASIVHAATPVDALQLFHNGETTAVAGARQALDAFAKARTDVRVLKGKFMVIEQALATSRDSRAAFDCLQAFIERAIASGFVERTLAEYR
jgi:polar amino acid transport system substrate-binding protein